ncbi:MAG: NAD-binding protein [Micromonosporaceae bacterium]
MRARSLVAAINTDTENVYVRLSARSLRPDLIIIARAAPRRRSRSCCGRALSGS